MATQKAEKSVQEGDGMGWAAWDEEINGNDGGGTSLHLGMSSPGASRNGAGSRGNDQARRGQGPVSLLEGQAHVT